jgi:uncharacterized protein with HEPN domain
MSRREELYLNDIIQAIERINSYVKNVSADEFKLDALRADAVLFNLMTIGEAVKNIPDAVRQRSPDIRWRDISRFRDRVVHHYFSLDLDIVWEIVTQHLAPLKGFIETLVKEIQSEDAADESDVE